MKLLCTLLTILITNQYRVLCRRNPSRDRKFSWNNVESEYRETVPIRVDEAGQSVFSQDKQFLSYINRVPDSELLYYHVIAFERTFKFKLVRDRSFVSPGLQVEHVFNDSVSIPYRGELGHCFYRGRLEEDSLSTVLFNLCNGLRGSFTTEGIEYFIDHTEEEEEKNSISGGKIHVVYRRLENARSTNTSYDLGELYFPDNSSEYVIDLNQDEPRISRKKRSQRYYIEAAYLETMITADRSMVEAFPNKAELQSYLITIMGMVARIYRDRSIGNFIKVVLVKIFMLETDLSDLQISSSATNSLTSFCNWQKKMNKPSDSNPGHYDTAILITKRDICRAAGKCDTLGLAQLSTVCSTSRSCAIVEDSGLNTAFTVAHELAHVFSVAHDGDRNICTKQKGTSNIMAPSLSFDTKPWTWSPCSRRALTEFLELGYGWCLEDKPDSRRQTSYEDRLPGEKYSAHEQCRFIFGSKSGLCPAMEPCRRLWCVKQIGKQQGCQTHHMPWADGTPCAKDKWCIRGVCVKQRRLQPVDGQWGRWSSFGSCSRTCGGGIRFSHRRCDNPAPENGGFYCRGAHKKFESCNTRDCPDNIDFRAIQCARHNKPMKIKGYLRKVNLVPKYVGVRKEERCSLFCRVSGEAIYFRVKKKVEDGTPCNQYSSDVCVDGQCRAAGCDRVVGSKARFDLCAVCKGDNSTCRKYNARYNKKTKYGYNFIYDIPVGSTNVRITQQGLKPEDDNFLALRSKKRNKYLLNGGYVVGLGVREFVYNGAKVWYSGSDKKLEEIRISGKTREAIKVEVLAVGSLDLPNIEYSLYIPSTGRRKKNRFAWHVNGPWTQCSRICRGRRRRQIMCRRQSDNRVVSNRRCKRYPRPAAIKEPCNTNCRLRWNTKREDPCSVRCGSGTQPQNVRCMRVSGRRMEIIADEYCKHLSRPPDSVPCKGECKDSKWIYSDWSECSKSCGAGVQRRTVNCIDVGGGYLPDNDCRESDKQPLQQPCNDQKCPTWSTGRWSSCSVTCGQGRESRQVSCNNGEKAFPDSACQSGVKPSTTRSCSRDACPQWTTTVWSECSVSCGKGVQTRQVNCRNMKKVFPESACQARAKPAGQKPCSPGKCPYWITTGWSKCSVTCGAGRKTRQVTCHYPLDNSVVSKIPCNATAKPMGNKPCFKRECPPVPTTPRYSGSWSEGEWTQCSVTCDQGIKTREVLCRDSRGIVIPDINCNEEEKPQQETSCLVKPCTSWKHGEWGLCSKPCGQGIQLRIVKCAFDNWEIAEDSRCDPSKKPPDYRPCEIRPCRPRPVLSIPQVFTSTDSLDNQPTTPFSPRWEVKQWSPCSVTCGKGVRNRAVACKLRNDERSSLCSPHTKPQTTFVCNLGPCPKWIAQPWSQCSKSCGSGNRYRIIRCNGGNRKCDNNTKPTETEVCNVQKCPKWIMGSWSKCSVTCGKGFQLRSVSCSTRNGNCNRSKKPSQIRSCKYVQCPKWRLGIWSECTVTCGKGFQIRNITCGSNTLPCDTRHKPIDRRVCNTKTCPIWRAGAWSKCSTTCGGGMRLRPVTCHPIRGQCNPQTKPRDTEECNIEECPRWIAGSWNECSVSCGGGVTSRKVRCNNKRIPVLCKASKKPSTTKSCNVHRCPRWTLTRWSECSVTCGVGVQTRSVTCNSKRGQQCDARMKPERTRACNAGRCPSWVTGRWSECSKTCSDGLQLRKVECDGVRGSCDIIQRPLVTKKCNLGACPEWNVGNWSDCSVSCGEGVRSRDVVCSTGDDKCRTLPKPNATKVCVLSMCPSWVVGLWSKCSTTCDEGLQKREVTCKPASARCDRRIKPEGSRICNLGLCPKWDPGSWSECSVSCGEGVRRRVIRCSSKHFPCHNKTRPIHMERCNLGLCPKWSVGHWSICSVSCGDGMQTRDVQCSTGDDRCVAKKPSTKRSCNLGECPKWVVGPWEYCSVTCGLGVEKRIVYCNTRDGRCDEKVKPTSSQNCKMTDCPSWSAGPWSQCSVTCGPGIRIRRIQCISTQNSVCNAETKPAETERCHKGPCPKWLTNDWSKCSVTCGMGFQSRSVTCSDQERKCNPDRKPLTILQCDRGECPSWTVGPWEQCSTTCGDGIQRREVICRAGGKTALCDEESKPSYTRKCNPVECPVWTVGLWSECSVTCGMGFQSRSVICSDRERKCNPDRKPLTILQCDRGECPSWTVGPWEQCSTTCGDGIQRREVICRAGGKPALCDEESKPNYTRKCNPMECPVWTVGLWSECSVTCGMGFQSRSVICSDRERKCNPDRKPLTILQCDRGECPSWTVGPWEQCSTTCGDGIQRREVICRAGGKPALCDEESKPNYTRKCNPMECPVWTVGLWSECSKTCGEGIKRRPVICRTDDELATCEESSKPAATEKCNIMECPVWTVGLWSECSATCGDGVQRRDVGCRAEKSATCDENSKPTETRICNRTECPVWTAGLWSECSATCGEAVQRREVTCTSASGELNCNERSKPMSMRACELEVCPTWITGNWSKCSVTCGKGTSTREVKCNSQTNKCEKENKPAQIKSCNRGTCPSWVVGPWSQCSVTCGKGKMERSVNCTVPNKCVENTKPSTDVICNMGSCARWHTGEWSQCSVSCGQGRKTRTVRCMDGDRPSNECTIETRPSSLSSCGSVQDCPSWTAGNWTQCSRSCGIGVASRLVRCLQGNKVLGFSSCDARKRPVIRRACQIQECVKGAFWSRGPWGKCSEQCSEGIKTRQIKCVARNGTQIEDKYCDRRKVPHTTRSCNKYKECGEWEVGPWSKCSTSCGDGLKTRAVRCLHNLEYTREDNCDLSKKPIHQLFCENNICPLSSAVFRWQKTSWSKCSRTCGYGRKARRVICVNNNGNKVDDRYCNAKAKPDQFLPCFEVRCPPKWKFGDWSECSRTCGHGGYQVRPVTCEGVPGAGGCNVRNKPPVWRPCNFGPCSGEFKWKVGSWSQCSVSCGIGVMKRDVHCYDKQERRRPDSFCILPALKPDETRPCHMIPCTPRTCREIQITSGLQADGEHVLEIQGRLLKIYCHGMTTDNPKEYITLKSGTKDNFAEIYPMRLLNPYHCPRNRSTESCPCEPRSYEESGGAYFSKIRFDINNMIIIADDMEFAVTRGLKPPIYGTAGDCFSLANCPQGRFSINLQGTGFELSPEVRWVKSGRSASQVIYRYPEGQQVIGKCGGYCGKCRPDERVGLKLIVSKGN